MTSHTLKSYISEFPNFPAKGVHFKDVSPLLENPKAFQKAIDLLSKLLKNKRFTKIIGIDARGFIFASALAYKLKKGFVMCRKPGKLPGKLMTKKYSYEYASAAVSMQKDRLTGKDSFIIVDDVLASGNTALTAYKIAQENSKVVAIIFLIELSVLGGRKYLLEKTTLKNHQILSVIQY